MRLLALILLVLVPEVRAQTVAVYASADSVRVGEHFELTLVARHGVLTEAVLPDTGRAFGGADLAVLERLSVGTRFGGREAPGTRVDSAVYRVAAFALDTLVVPPIAIEFVQGSDTALVPTPSFTLPMIATAPADASALQPARERMDFPLPWWVWAAVLLGVLALALLAYVLVRRYQRRGEAPTAPVETRSPAERARYRLEALAAADLTAPEQVKPYYVALTEAVREYIEVTTGIPALELTSGELVRRVQHAAREGRLPADLPEHLIALFPVADYAKFADGLPPAEEGERVRQEALAVVDRVEAHRRAAVAATVESADA